MSGCFECSLSEKNPPAKLVRIKTLRYKETSFCQNGRGSPT
ncbi:hypothetical protein CLOSTMETH_00915, partial [[Clostridium] methylpentosum DSM 5476]